MNKCISTSFVLFATALHAACSFALGNIAVSVEVDKHNEPLENAVITARPIGSNVQTRMPTPKEITINQINKEFVKEISLIFTGDSVSFPNGDQIDHNVYSFSSAKQFELPLYKGVPEESVIFDKPGVVTLGCNIHDWMVAYVYVSDTPYAGTTDAKVSLVLSDLPDGEYDVFVWHPKLKANEEKLKQRVRVDGNTASVGWDVDLKTVFRPRRAPMGVGQDY